MEEVWKDVVGYEGLYKVSNLGNVKSLNWGGRGYSKNLWLKPHPRGYLKVELCANGKKKSFVVHRLVAIAFIPNPKNLPQVNHIDEDKRNNRAENLEWCTSSYNALYSAKRHPERAKIRKQRENAHISKSGKNKGKKVLQITLDGDVIKEWNNSREIFVNTGMSDWSITECCRGKRNKAYGYKWQYANLS